MSARSKLVLLFVLLVLLMQLGWAEKIADIQPQGYVTDLANVINPATRQKIEMLGTELQQKTGAQIAVVTVNSLEGQTREDYTADLYKHLGVGAKKDSRGVLILIAPKDRQYKIEVGYGLEPVINDARAGDVGREMVPDLRKGDYSAAALTGAIGGSAVRRRRCGRAAHRRSRAHAEAADTEGPVVAGLGDLRRNLHDRSGVVARRTRRARPTRRRWNGKRTAMDPAGKWHGPRR